MEEEPLRLVGGALGRWRLAEGVGGGGSRGGGEVMEPEVLEVEEEHLVRVEWEGEATVGGESDGSALSTLSESSLLRREAHRGPK